MSAWPEAVWIVKKLQKNFDFDQQIDIYTNVLNNVNATVNRLNDRVADDEATLATLRADLTSRATTIRAVKKSSTNEPDTTETYGKGTIWFIVNGL